VMPMALATMPAAASLVQKSKHRSRFNLSLHPEHLPMAIVDAVNPGTKRGRPVLGSNRSTPRLSGSEKLFFEVGEVLIEGLGESITARL
jgi:hypothetical protein